MAWQPFATFPDEKIWRGARFLLPGTSPAEPLIELLLIERPDAGGLGLMVDTGYKAGLDAGVFPDHAMSTGTRALSTEWLKRHWNDHVVYAADVASIMIDPRSREARR